MKMKKIVLCLSLVYMNNSSYSESTIVEPESYCEIVKKIAYNAQSYRQSGVEYKVTIKKLQTAPEKLSTSKEKITSWFLELYSMPIIYFLSIQMMN